MKFIEAQIKTARKFYWETVIARMKTLFLIWWRMDLFLSSALYQMEHSVTAVICFARNANFFVSFFKSVVPQNPLQSDCGSHQNSSHLSPLWKNKIMISTAHVFFADDNDHETLITWKILWSNFRQIHSKSVGHSSFFLLIWMPFGSDQNLI